MQTATSCAKTLNAAQGFNTLNYMAVSQSISNLLQELRILKKIIIKNTDKYTRNFHLT